MPSKVFIQDPPNALQIELTEGCSLNCTYCGVQGIRESKGGYKFLTVELAKEITKRLKVSMDHHNWNPRVEFAMHGEPTVNKDLESIARLFSKLKLRELILVSNGTGFVKDPNSYIKMLEDVGFTSVCLDEYDNCDFVQQIRDKYTGDVELLEYGSEKFRGNKDRFKIVIKKDVAHLTKAYDKVNTHCGGGVDPGQSNPAINKRCGKPFRELSIRWDGNVALCCNDFRGIYKIGNVVDFSSLDALWQSEKFLAARKVLYNNSRDFIPCVWCDAISPRVGLLPDKLGKKTLPEPTQKDMDTIAECVKGKPYTMPVLRGWELKGNVCLPEDIDTSKLKTQKIDK